MKIAGIDVIILILTVSPKWLVAVTEIFIWAVTQGPGRWKFPVGFRGEAPVGNLGDKIPKAETV